MEKPSVYSLQILKLLVSKLILITFIKPNLLISIQNSSNLPIVESKISPDYKFQVPDELCCTLCKELVREPVKTPCCHQSYCRECISKELLSQGSGSTIIHTTFLQFHASKMITIFSLSILTKTSLCLIIEYCFYYSHPKILKKNSMKH